MTNSATALTTRAVEHSLSMSPFPPSSGGQLGAFALSLGSLMTIFCLTLMVCGWMVAELWRDRKRRDRSSLITFYRCMVVFATAAGVIATGPHVLYMLAWNDPKASPEFLAWLLRIERMADSVRVLFAAAWLGIFFVIYPLVCVSITSGPAAQVSITRQHIFSIRSRLFRPIAVAAVAALLSYTVAIIKGAEPVPAMKRDTVAWHR